MEQSKLLHLLRTFTKKEFKLFEQYINSDSVYARSDTHKLYNYLRGFAPQFKAKELRKEEVQAYLFPTVKRQHYLYWVMSDLVRLIEDFWTKEALPQHSFYKQQLLLGVYEARQLYKYISDSLDIIQREEESQPFRSFDYWARQVTVSKLTQHTEMLQNRQKFDLRQRELAIDVYFVAEKLQLYIDRATREQNWGTPLTDPLILSLMELVDRSTELQNIPLVELHYQTVRCFSDNSVELFTAFLDFLLKNGAFFPYDELRRAYTFAENCCAIQIRQGNSVYWQQLLDLYRLEILTQIIYNPNGSISTPLFRNVITVAMRLGEYDWGLDFIETNKERLPISEREDVYQYNIANLYFHQKNYDKVLDLLNTIHYLNILYKLAARTLRLKTYYELKSTESPYENLLESELTAFKAFIYRLEGIEKEDKTLYRNFMLFLEKLVRLNFTDQKKKQALYQKISSTAMVAEKVWLMKSCE